MPTPPLTASAEANDYIDAAIRLASHIDIALATTDNVPITARLVEHVERYRATHEALYTAAVKP